MFMRVNSKCAHQLRPPLTRPRAGSRPASSTHRVRLPYEIGKVWSIGCGSAEVSPQQDKRCRADLTFSVRAIDARHAEPGVWKTPDS